jgi:hypothetical protein
MMVVYIQTQLYLYYVRFRDLYPISLSGLDYNQQETDIQYLTASVTFAYKIYEFAAVSGGRTIETTS